MKKIILLIVLCLISSDAFASVNPSIDKQFCGKGKIVSVVNYTGTPIFIYTCSDGNSFPYPDGDLMERPA